MEARVGIESTIQVFVDGALFPQFRYAIPGSVPGPSAGLPWTKDRTTPERTGLGVAFAPANGIVECSLLHVSCRIPVGHIEEIIDVIGKTLAGRLAESFRARYQTATQVHCVQVSRLRRAKPL